MNTSWPKAWIALLTALPLAGELHAQVPVSLSKAVGTPFVENRGQWSDDVRFTAIGGGWRVAIEDRGWRLAVAGESGRGCVVRMQVKGCEGSVPLGLDAGAALSNYFLGERSGIGARSFARVRYPGLVPGVDVLLRSEAGSLEYDLELAPGADLDALVFEIEGATLAEIGADGSLTLETPLGALRQSPARAFEIDASGAVHDCASAFVRLDDTHFGFTVPERRADARLVIDPALIWSTYIGGTIAQSAHAIVDAHDGTAVIAGNTESGDFPTTPGVFDTTLNGANDVFVSAIDGQGALLWSTFLGGLADDFVEAMAIHSNGAVTIAGTTSSTNFPVTAGAFDTSFGGVADGFVARLSAAGTLLTWSTFLGGTQRDELHALAIDSANGVSVGGWTRSGNYPVSFGAYDTQLAPGGSSDACLSYLLADGSALSWSTFLGGSSVDGIAGIALAPSGILVGGATQSVDFPFLTGVYLGGEDGFVARFNPGATQLLMSVAIGGPGDDHVRAVASDASDHAFAAGRTNSSGMPVTAGVFGPLHGGLDDGFLVQLAPSGATLASTFLGGTGSDDVLAMVLGKSGDLFAAGWTDSADFPTTPGAFDRALNSGSPGPPGDIFVIRATTDLEKLGYSTFFGGADDERAFSIAAIDADTVLFAGETASFFFPTTPGAHRTVRGVSATMEGFASRLDLLKHPIEFGLGKLTSSGASPLMRSQGFPSVADNNFRLVVDSAMPNQTAVVFVGGASWNQPFLGGTLYVRPPVKRVGVLSLDFVGYAELPYTLTAPKIGTTFFAQAWFQDPGDSLGCGISSALEVLVYP